MQRKQQIRAVLKENRKQLSPEKIVKKSERICENLLKYILKDNPEMIYFYYPLGSEVNLLPLAEILLMEGIKIAFPRTNHESMDFYPVTSLCDFQKGTLGIMEPIGKNPSEKSTPLVLVPGLGFDEKGNRIGYGKGFYDRYFSRFPDCRKIGIAYDIQIIKKIPINSHDIPMDMIITEKGRR